MHDQTITISFNRIGTELHDLTLITKTELRTPEIARLLRVMSSQMDDGDYEREVAN